MSFLKVTPPPLIFGMGFLAGLLIHVYFAPALLPTDLSFWLGWLSIAVSVVFVLPVLLQFRHAKTPFDVRKTPKTLITTGLYGCSRNPAYVSLSMLYLGGGVLLNSFAILAFFVPCFLIVHRVIVPTEESRLETEFGDEYRTFKEICPQVDLKRRLIG